MQHGQKLVVPSRPPCTCSHAFWPLLHRLAACPRRQMASLLAPHPRPQHTGTQQMLTCFLTGSLWGLCSGCGLDCARGLSMTPRHTLGERCTCLSLPREILVTSPGTWGTCLCTCEQPVVCALCHAGACVPLRPVVAELTGVQNTEERENPSFHIGACGVRPGNALFTG